MGLCWCILWILAILLLHHIMLTNSLHSLNQQPTCHDEESSSLLQFKQSFILEKNASRCYEPPCLAYPKVNVSSWKLVHNGDNSSCCSWDGVECDKKTGHVIGLDLSSSWLNGSINSNSSLFRLVHLQSLNLAFNDFNQSQIPTSIRNFQQLRYLNLSGSRFSGQVPFEVSQLSKLSSLDMSHNYLLFSKEGLLRGLAQNLTLLETLDLSSINISSTVPDTLQNLTFLKTLRLGDCSLFGELPISTFKLQNLKVLDLYFNPDLKGYFPEFNGSSPLISLTLSDSTALSISLTSLVAQVNSLEKLHVWECHILEGEIPASVGNLTRMTDLWLSNNRLCGSIPESLFNLVNLESLHLGGNNLSGEIPASVGNHTRLLHLWLHDNRLSGSIPESLFNLVNLESFDLRGNNLSGTVEIQKFLNLKKLSHLSLSDNKLELLTKSSLSNHTTQLPKFENLYLSYCNIREFPSFLRHQDKLQYLDLSGNNMEGQVPKWMWNTSRETLKWIDISHNFLSGFEESPTVLPWVNLWVLDLSFNMLRGSLLIPASTTFLYVASNNNFSGEVSPLICNLSSLKNLDLSNNKLSGMLPQCGTSFGDSLQYLNLGNNSFRGNLPLEYPSWLEFIDFSHNHFNGKLPRSLANCSSLEGVVLSHNRFIDVFPDWLGTLPKLKILALDHNGFYGVIGKPAKNLEFPVLSILDLSYNSFSGHFPFECIFSGNGTTSVAHDNLEYYVNNFVGMNYYKMIITSKGVERYYSKIPQNLIFIDISSNKFEGQIPDFIGKLDGLWSLNMSNNNLTGRIPSSLGNLTLLESLDLSQNKLSGEIPQQLAQLTFLAKLNVSHNYLTGPIPAGTQLSTFNVTSYEGNPGLCGDQLPKKCGPKAPQLPRSTQDENDSAGSGLEVDWKFAVAGLVSGLLVGVVLADFVIMKRKEWFIEIVAVLIRLTKRMRRFNN